MSTAANNINSDRRQLAIMHTTNMDWQPSPTPTVWRKRLEHIGDSEKGLVTSVVRFNAGSRFPRHGHPDGEELLILDGTFSDEYGDYPPGTFLLNPRGFEHEPFSHDGCTLFVKLRQYPGVGRRHVRVDSQNCVWHTHDIAGVEFLTLYQDPDHPEQIRLLRFAPRARIPPVAFPGGEEIFVIDGQFADEHGQYQRGSWVRYPAGSGHTPHTDEGCTLYVKKGHLESG